MADIILPENSNKQKQLVHAYLNVQTQKQKKKEEEVNAGTSCHADSHVWMQGEMASSETMMHKPEFTPRKTLLRKQASGCV